MLAALHISNFVLIERQEVYFGPGLNVLSGETGAGKSILLDALGLCLGDKSDPKSVRVGADEAIITAEFLLDDDLMEELAPLCSQSGIPLEDDVLILRRVVPREGRSRAFVQDAPVSQQLLHHLRERLVEIHGQGEVGRLARRSWQRQALDEFAGNNALLLDVSESHAAWAKEITHKEELEALIRQDLGQREELALALEEFDRMAPLPGEEEELAGKRQEMVKFSKLVQDLEHMRLSLSGDGGAEERIIDASRILGRINDQLPEQLASLEGLMDQALEYSREAAGQIEDALGGFGGDQAALERIEERLFALRELARKHRMPASNLHHHHESLAKRMEHLSSMEEKLQAAETAIHQKRVLFDEVAARLTKVRQEAAKRLADEIMNEFAGLKLERARFEVALEQLPQPASHGHDQVTFLAAMNKGQALAPFHEVASGGEQSRFLLALRVALGAKRNIPVQLFDEVDQGIGGQTAAAVGTRLEALGQHGQVILVTHSPQVAAKGARHFLVEKGDRDGVTFSQLRLLDDAERQEEIARMLAGDMVTDEARKAAMSLLS